MHFLYTCSYYVVYATFLYFNVCPRVYFLLSNIYNLNNHAWEIVFNNLRINKKDYKII